MEKITSSTLIKEYKQWGKDKDGFIKFIYENFLVPDFSPRKCNALYKGSEEGFKELYGKLIKYEDQPLNFTVKIRMGAKAMSNLMYAVIITESKVTSTQCFCKSCTRKDNSYNHADVLVVIKQSQVDKFKELSGIDRLEEYKFLSVK